VKNIEDAVVVVTIITDGLENASKEYTGAAVKQLVEQLKGEGWTFTYMGANQDSVEVAFNLSIRNARNFDYSASGTMAGMAKDASTRMNFFGRLHAYASGLRGKVSKEERNADYASMADEAFDEEESKR
jgi:hypothetical protein